MEGGEYGEDRLSCPINSPERCYLIHRAGHFDGRRNGTRCHSERGRECSRPNHKP